MRVRVPDYYDRFRCLAGACPHTCCEKWEVVIDETTAAHYAAVPGPLGERLRAALTADAGGDLCFALNGERCPFLDRDGLCEIHRELGEEATSITCRAHPRFLEDYGPFREITLSAACPAANALLLSKSDPLTFLEREDDAPAEPGDPWLCWLVPLRDRLLDLLRDRSRPLSVRLRDFLLLALRAQLLLEDGREEALADLAASRQVPPPPLSAGGPGVLPFALSFLRTLEPLDGDWPALLRRAETAPDAPVPEPLLERAAVYFAFRHLLKAVNDGDLLGRAELTVLAVLAARRLAGVCGGLGEALRRLCREIGHDENHLAALLVRFRQDEALCPAAFLRSLSAF